MLAYICYEKSIRGLNWGWIRILLMCCGTTKPSVTLWMNCQLSFLKPYALLDKEVNVSTCLTNIQWGCESGHPTLNDKIFWPAGQEAYKRVFSLSIMLQEGSQTWITGIYQSTKCLRLLWQICYFKSNKSELLDHSRPCIS